MKKSLAILLLLLIAVGCDDSTETEQPTEHPVEQPTEPAKESITKPLDMKFNKIPAGTFMMGSPETEEGRYEDEHQHKVKISKAFYMQTTEVTQGQWKAVMETEPWKGEDDIKEGANYPAIYISWDDAVAYCKKLSEKEGKTYRLPTEAEWEYACRAGTKTTWSFGDDEKVLGDYAWYFDNVFFDELRRIQLEKYAHQVGLKKPNAFGLYDMHGNVWEWCHDYFDVDYYKRSPEKDPQGPASSTWDLTDLAALGRLRPMTSSRFDPRGNRPVIRGGATTPSSTTRSAIRSWLSYNTIKGKIVSGTDNSSGLGFRVVRELD